MHSRLNRWSRWLVLIGSGAVMLQATGCQFAMEALQTGFLGAITGGVFWLARNV